MQLHKTNRARAELKPGVRTLGQRERTLLLLADGSKSVQDFKLLFDGSGEEMVLRLLQEGFLETQAAPERPLVTATPPLPARPAADRFDGKRSLATTRMFLFDICERMFARRHPEMAEHFREALRNAKDRESMLAASRLILEHIETVAGHERASSIGERIEMLLPDNSLADMAA
ncbi:MULTISPECIES: hypothetical protein [Polaromonas]|uniref:Uncharacterized protein n=2 Tax=Polaromonas TaxID=52972 RepID=A1VQQ6_POLNA|nr:hypothetical protein [Polaromonas naphthalenivorans]ABM37984.1 hypothetical protein Pnap_2682 [Polaromonas naphthalenivorans CJ2]MBH2010919.1 hypothetical protein [Xanthomonadaceae bacterium]